MTQTQTQDEAAIHAVMAASYDAWAAGDYELACKLFTEVVLSAEFVEFLTVPAYAEID